jgi:ribosome-associated protein
VATKITAKKKIIVKKKTTSAKPAARKTVAKKTAVKKTVTKKPVAKKAATKTAPAKKSIVKKPAKAASKANAAKVAKKPAPMKSAPAKAVPVTVMQQPVKPLGIPEQMRDVALKVLDERQAEDIVSVSLQGRSSIADYMIIASGRAGRQVIAIADYLREAFYKLGAKNLRIEGLAEANWVLIDGGDVIVHLFRPEVRKYYDLDAIWASSAPPPK